MRLALVLAVMAAACKKPGADSGPCACTPANVSRTKRVGEAAPMDGASLLVRLRAHRDAVARGDNPRAIKIADDELRYAILEFCQPCGDWVGERLTVDEMYPLADLDRATRGVCMGLVLPDGTTSWGTARPQNCR